MKRPEIVRLLPTLLASLFSFGYDLAAASELGSVQAKTETEAFFDDDAGNRSDADDPAIWVHPAQRSESLVIATLKEGGLVVFDLNGKTLQRIAAPKPPREGDRPGRFNNVDLLSGFPLSPRRKVDLAVVTDRGLDRLKIYRIDPLWARSGRGPLTEITAAAESPFVFSADQDEVNRETTAYGLAVGYERRSKSFVGFVSRRERVSLAKVKFFPAGNGTVGYRVAARLDLPKDFALPSGGSWTPCQDEDGQQPQVEGMVWDEEHATLYAGQEQVGLWRIGGKRFAAADAKLIDTVKTFGVAYDRIFDDDEGEFSCEYRPEDSPGIAGDRLEADVEGLTIYKAGRLGGYLLASSQGDNTFAVYQRAAGNRYLGSFEIAGSEATDSVEESDGAMAVNSALGPDYPYGLFVTQDGENVPEALDENGEARANTNFKFVPWENIANAFERPLQIRPR